MNRTPSQRNAQKPAIKAGTGRDERLKAALKANIARRKAQARARAADDTGSTDNEQK